MPLTLASNAITFTDSTALSSGIISTAQLASSVQQLLVPAGCVMSFAMSAAPVGWYPCDGTTVSRTGSGANLFAAIGTTYGIGNNSTTFNVPNLQGQFIRGLTTNFSTVSRDPLSASRVLGNVQGDAFQGHRHQWRDQDPPNNILDNYAFIRDQTGTGSFNGNTGGGNTFSAALMNDPTTQSGFGDVRTDIETRPVNIALLYCIKL